jgi:hypothetical protein
MEVDRCEEDALIAAGLYLSRKERNGEKNISRTFGSYTLTNNWNAFGYGTQQRRKFISERRECLLYLSYDRACRCSYG